MCRDTASRPMPVFWGPEDVDWLGTGDPLPGSTLITSPPETQTADNRSRDTVITLDSIRESWVLPPNFLLFCLQIKERDPADCIQLWLALGASTPLGSGVAGPVRVTLYQGPELSPGSTLLLAEPPYWAPIIVLPGACLVAAKAARGGLDPARHIRIKVVFCAGSFVSLNRKAFVLLGNARVQVKVAVPG